MDVGVDLVRRLLAEQHPDLADRQLVALASGWDNVLFRLGDDLLVRLPRRAAAVDLVRHEQLWLPRLAPHLPLAVPEPLRLGVAGAGYPWPWSICRYVPGTSALEASNGLRIDDADIATALGHFCRALHRPAPEEAPHNPFRGIPLAGRDAMTRQRIAQLGTVIDAASTLDHWERAMAVAPWPGPALWLHGDLHPGNLVVDDGRLVAVIDFGDLTAGDPATDLAVAWMLLPPEHHPTLRALASEGGVDDDTWARARGWALSLALAILAGSADDPAYHRLATATLAAVARDPG